MLAWTPAALTCHPVERTNEMANEQQTILPNGNEVTLTKDRGQWTVDLWIAGEHQWSKGSSRYVPALSEYERNGGFPS